MGRWRWLLAWLLLWVCLESGCTLASMASHLNERDVKSCIYMLGFVGPFQAVRSVTATGGMTLEECAGFR